MLNKYIYTDKELKEHYKNKSLSPIYKTQSFIDRKIHYAVVSKNDTLPLLILIHGAPGAWYGYMNLMDDSLLQTKFKLISVDRLGYGKSDYGKAEVSIQVQALAIKKIIDAENINNKKVVLLGRSYGAPIAAWLAINYPLQIKELVMVSPVIDPEKEKFFWFSDIGRWKAVQVFLPKMLNVAAKEKFAHAKEMTKMIPKWKKLYVSTTVITGESDWIADTANFTFAKKYLINCPTNFIKLKNTGHLVTYQQPELVKQVLLKEY
ncbi:MAG: alpha/beta hydrolase [Bacteroidota bacterium]|nr:alpha/beta hydrolase [Bacteroidota bacterium]